jgi:hypothetical protein
LHVASRRDGPSKEVEALQALALAASPLVIFKKREVVDLFHIANEGGGSCHE